jgi:hypothetical protein
MPQKGKGVKEVYTIKQIPFLEVVSCHWVLKVKNET